MKIAVTGKGGVGKTTISSLLSLVLKARGNNVVAIDADPDSNLAACMGHPDPGSIRPLVELKDLIGERTGIKPGTTGGMFQLNPFVADIPEKFSVEIDGVRVLVAGAVKKGGTGCYCPENTLLRALVSHLLLDPDTALVIDMEAGVEHLSRGTVQSVDHLLIVVDPGRRGIETALRIKTMADEIGLAKVSVIGNRVRDENDKSFIRKELAGMNIAGFLDYDEEITSAERDRKGARSISSEVRESIGLILDSIV